MLRFSRPGRGAVKGGAMPVSVIFWVLMIIAAVVGVAATRGGPYFAWGGSFLIWILLFLLGWRVFGFIVSG